MSRREFTPFQGTGYKLSDSAASPPSDPAPPAPADVSSDEAALVAPPSNPAPADVISDDEPLMQPPAEIMSDEAALVVPSSSQPPQPVSKSTMLHILNEYLTLLTAMQTEIPHNGKFVDMHNKIDNTTVQAVKFQSWVEEKDGDISNLVTDLNNLGKWVQYHQEWWQKVDRAVKKQHNALTTTTVSPHHHYNHLPSGQGGWLPA